MGLSLRGQTSGAIDINAPAVAGDNTITLPNGNGSANQFYKNSTTAGIVTHSSMVELANEYVGIGSTIPREKLDIGDGRIILDQDYQFTWANGTTNRVRIYGDSGNNFVVENGSSNTERFRITSGGDLNIGKGDESTNAANVVEMYVGATDGSYGAIRGKYNRTNEFNRSEVRFGVENNSSGLGFLAFATGNNSATERLRIDSSGRVGIGTTSSSSKLHVYDGASGGTPSSNAKLTVEDNDNAYLNLLVPSSFNCGVYFGDNDDADVGYINYSHGSNSLAFGVNASERVRIDSSGRLLIGATSSTNIDASLQVIKDGTAAQFHRGVANSNGPSIMLTKSRNTAYGSNTILQDGDTLGLITFRGDDGTDYATRGVQLSAEVDGTPGSNVMPGAFLIKTTPSGSGTPSERMRIKSTGEVLIPGTYSNTTASGVNVNVHTDGNLRRSTSSVKYKTNVETVANTYSDALLNCRPVWYRSTCAGDNPEYSWWGFIAEEVAEIDPRLVHWKTEEPVIQEDGSIDYVPIEPEAEGVAYDRFVPHLLNLIKRQKNQIETLEARLTALEGN